MALVTVFLNSLTALCCIFILQLLFFSEANDLYHELKTLIERLRKFLEQFKTDEDENYVILIKSLEKFVEKAANEQNISSSTSETFSG